MRYSIVIPTYNHCDDLLKPCVDSVFKHTHMPDVELIISANGCKDNTREYLDNLAKQFDLFGLADNFKIVWNDQPLGFAKATNEGIKVATTDRIVLLSNDTVLLEQRKNDWLNFLSNPFDSNEKCGITGVLKKYSPITERNFLLFFCVMVHRKVFDKIGLVDEDFGVGSQEDIAFCAAAILSDETPAA